MNIIRFTFLWMVIGLLPNIVQASVQITEIAWMGTDVSANHEWIEIINTGATKDLTGWTITDNNNLTISLSGTLAQGEVALLERTSDDSAPGSAFLIYTGALTNAGARLVVKNTAGNVVDVVDGRDNWSAVGGDNATKETAQLVNGSWVTRVATPGVVADIDTASDIDTNTELSEGSDEQVSLTTASVIAAPANRESHEKRAVSVSPGMLELAIVAPAAGVVGYLIEFNVEPEGVGNTIKNSLQYSWNFGDGTVASEKEAAHIFSHPGTYTVTVHGAYKQQEYVARHTVTIHEQSLVVSVTAGGVVQITNEGVVELDLGGYRVVADEVLRLPAHTYILPGQTMSLHTDLVGAHERKNNVRIHNTKGDIVSRMHNSVPAVASSYPLVAEQQQVSVQSIPALDPPAVTYNQNQFREAVPDTSWERTDIPIATHTPPTETRGSFASYLHSFDWSRILLVMIIISGMAAVYFIPSRPRADEEK